MRKISLAALLIPALAWAAPKTADEWYAEGANQYTLGAFDRAIDSFKQGFSLETDESKKANYLYNIAQAYRQTHDCKNALFFYKRYLAAKAGDTVKPIESQRKKQVEGFIAELEVCVKQQTQVSERPPVNNVPPEGEKPDKPDKTDKIDKTDKTDKGPPGDTVRKERKEVATGAPGSVPPGGETSEEEDTGVTQTATAPPRLISLRIDGGATKVTAGSNPVPVQATFALVGGYPIPIDRRLTVEVGAAFTFTPIPFDAAMTGGSRTAQMWGLLANAGATYEVIPKLGVRGDVGLGVLFFANVDHSPFTSGQDTSGALSMFHLRAAASADYAITPNLVITATPVAFTYSPPKAGLADDIKSITSIDFMIGIGYRK
ncbi:MAG: hypothetical protein E6J90_31575 [Deltaproteobacteria bacterium]|nr:MAG: hypothetical protein E6J91_50405 [Deltaproteobacteria bacterium]TMQ12391.1 MAG: hypothetical protein E6J90_31575 [Deltaproteobacteria bacterium]